MLDFLLMSQVKLHFADTMHPQNNNFLTGMENNKTGDSIFFHTVVKSQQTRTKSTSCLIKMVDTVFEEK